MAEFDVRAEERLSFSFTWYPSHEAQPETPDAVLELRRTTTFWREFAARCNYTGNYRSTIVRSLITLKALTYRPPTKRGRGHARAAQRGRSTAARLYVHRSLSAPGPLKTD